MNRIARFHRKGSAKTAASIASNPTETRQIELTARHRKVPVTHTAEARDGIFEGDIVGRVAEYHPDVLFAGQRCVHDRCFPRLPCQP